MSGSPREESSEAAGNGRPGPEIGLSEPEAAAVAADTAVQGGGEAAAAGQLAGLEDLLPDSKPAEEALGPDLPITADTATDTAEDSSPQAADVAIGEGESFATFTSEQADSSSEPPAASTAAVEVGASGEEAFEAYLSCEHTEASLQPEATAEGSPAGESADNGAEGFATFSSALPQSSPEPPAATTPAAAEGEGSEEEAFGAFTSEQAEQPAAAAEGTPSGQGEGSEGEGEGEAFAAFGLEQVEEPLQPVLAEDSLAGEPAGSEGGSDGFAAFAPAAAAAEPAGSLADGFAAFEVEVGTAAAALDSQPGSGAGSTADGEGGPSVADGWGADHWPATGAAELSPATAMLDGGEQQRQQQGAVAGEDDGVMEPAWDEAAEDDQGAETAALGEAKAKEGPLPEEEGPKAGSDVWGEFLAQAEDAEPEAGAAFGDEDGEDDGFADFAEAASASVPIPAWSSGGIQAAAAPGDQQSRDLGEGQEGDDDFGEFADFSDSPAPAFAAPAAAPQPASPPAPQPAESAQQQQQQGAGLLDLPPAAFRSSAAALLAPLLAPLSAVGAGAGRPPTLLTLAAAYPKLREAQEGAATAAGAVVPLRWQGSRSEARLLQRLDLTNAAAPRQPGSAKASAAKAEVESDADTAAGGEGATASAEQQPVQLADAGFAAEFPSPGGQGANRWVGQPSGATAPPQWPPAAPAEEGGFAATWDDDPFAAQQPVPAGALAAGASALPAAGPPLPQPAAAADPFAASDMFGSVWEAPAAAPQPHSPSGGWGGDMFVGAAPAPLAAGAALAAGQPAADGTGGWDDNFFSGAAPASAVAVPGAGEASALVEDDSMGWGDVGFADAAPSPTVSAAPTAANGTAQLEAAVEDDEWGDFDAAPPAPAAGPLGAVLGVGVGVAAAAVAADGKNGVLSAEGQSNAAVEAILAQMPDLSFMLAPGGPAVQ